MSLRLELPDRQAEFSEVLEERVEGPLVLLEGEARLVPVLLDAAELDVHPGVREALLALRLRVDALQEGVEGENFVLHPEERFLGVLLQILLYLSDPL